MSNWLNLHRNTSPYGVPQHPRSGAYASLYWANATTVLELIQKTQGKVDFDVMYNTLLPFMQFGPLISYLTTLDLMYAGIVAVPSDEYIARRLVTLRAGALKGLELIGLVRGTLESGRTYPTSDTDLTPALVDARDAHCILALYQRTKSLLDAKGKGHLMPDIMHMEHTLCKLSKANNTHIQSQLFNVVNFSPSITSTSQPVASGSGVS